MLERCSGKSVNQKSKLKAHFSLVAKINFFFFELWLKGNQKSGVIEQWLKGFMTHSQLK